MFSNLRRVSQLPFFEPEVESQEYSIQFQDNDVIQMINASLYSRIASLKEIKKERKKDNKLTNIKNVSWQQETPDLFLK